MRRLRRLRRQIQLPVGGAGRNHVRPQAQNRPIVSCNKDFSCLKGFCPALVTLEGDAQIRRDRKAGDPLNVSAVAANRRCRPSTSPMACW